MIFAVDTTLAATPLGALSAEELRRKPLAEVAREFEALLLAQMIGAMRRTVGDSGLLSASPERRMLDGFFDLELARSLVDELDLGLASQLTARLAPGDPAGAPETRAAVRPADRAAHASPGDAAGLCAPVAGRVSSPYGARRDPFSGSPAFHAGLDLAAPEGTPVRAAAPGRVAFSGPSGAAGRVVRIEHPDGTTTGYAHLARAFVAPGALVEAGDVIGAVGTSGRTTGPHLHFTVERGGRPLDPAPLLARGDDATRS